ncbi:ABC transporter ATP-binding protein [Rhodopirellula maiorica SM1]|uniref:ABC transporter ATP-binding protein n=1 Tax=Rhodopirellula maiorica SM1 TaxID=1265738 RepID=M5RY35_9BACT|nr:ABC transporter ATP-binding protein [Rhodopirellula maiorica]EMI20287.1 ABC transporter ATP-binding protein [Rhodopirellula maiorica SM1]
MDITDRRSGDLDETPLANEVHRESVDRSSHGSASHRVVIDVNDLKKKYSAWSIRGRNVVEALRGASLQVHAGEVFGLLGPNGAGKTTLIKILLGVIRSSSGSASLFGAPAGSIAARMRVGYLPESLRVDRHHSARSALRYYARMSQMSGAEINRRSDELLELVGLRGRDRESVRQFSKGMYQRLGLAQALMHDPDLLVLDEPTDGLDPVGRNEVRKVIDRLRESGKTIFLNSHILQEVELICSRVAIMSHGKICVAGRIDELTQFDRFEEVAFEVAMPAAESAGQAPSEWLRENFPAIQFVGNTLPHPTPPSTDRDAQHALTLDFTLPLSTQAEVDEVVDALRRHHFSLRGLKLKRESFEETFMREVSRPKETS